MWCNYCFTDPVGQVLDEIQFPRKWTTSSLEEYPVDRASGEGHSLNLYQLPFPSHLCVCAKRWKDCVYVLSQKALASLQATASIEAKGHHPTYYLFRPVRWRGVVRDMIYDEV